MNKQPEVLQITAAIGVLCIGVLVYVLDRQPGSAYFIPNWFALTINFSPIFGEIGNYLPTFIHTFAFILLTVIIVAPSSLQVVLICIAWLAVDSLFEIAQITSIAYWIAGHVPGWFAGVPFLENTSAYFINGTFDSLDLVSIAAGTVTAFLVIKVGQYGRKHHVHES